MGSVSAMGGQGNCVSGTSPLTCVTLYILSLPILALHTPLSLSLPPSPQGGSLRQLLNNQLLSVNLSAPFSIPPS